MQEPRPLQCPSSAHGAAFSLIELLVVVAICLVLFVLYWNHGPSKRDRELTACRQNLEKVYLALQIYAHDNGEKYPVTTSAATAEDALALLVPHYTSDTLIFLCPATSDSPLPDGKTFREGKISYAYYMGRRSTDEGKALMSDAQINTLSKHVGDTIFSENGKAPGNNHGKDGGNFLMCDGNVVSSFDSAVFPVTFTPPVVLLNPKP